MLKPLKLKQKKKLYLGYNESFLMESKGFA